MEEQVQPKFDVCMALLILLAAGMFTVFVATREGDATLAGRQLLWIALGACGFAVLQRIDYRHYAEQAMPLYGVGIVMLLAVFVLGKKINGAISWIDLGFFNLQPSEFARITTLMMLARLYEINQGVFFRSEEIIKAVAIVLLPTAMLLLQPDLGMSLIYLAMLGSFFVMSRISHYIHITYITLTILLSISLYGIHHFVPDLFFELIRPHQFERLTSFLYPEADPLGSGYQYIQARKVVGSGQLGGTGALWVLTANGAKLPEQHTDFIFAVIAQQWGFAGASLLLLLYFFLFYRLISWAIKTPDPFAAFFISGVVTMWAFQVFVNIGMNIGLSPITGLTLPFISYGGSSLLSNMLTFGMIISMRHPSPMWKLKQV